MPHVRDSYVFKDDFKDYGPLSLNLWKDHFYIYTLTEIMCQKGEKQFCKVLNRLRIGELTESDNALFMSRIEKKSDAHYVPDAPHFFPLKESTRKHNETVYLNSISEKVEIKVHHVISGNPSVKARGKCLLVVKTAAKYCEVQGLQRVLKIAVGLAYTASVNIKTDDGLISGATCILKKIHYFQGNCSKHPDILWVLF